VLPKFLHQQWIDESESTRQFISYEEESRVLRVAAESFLQLKLAERMEFPLSKKKKLAERMDAGYRLTDEAPSKFFLTFQIKKKIKHHQSSETKLENNYTTEHHQNSKKKIKLCKLLSTISQIIYIVELHQYICISNVVSFKFYLVEMYASHAHI